jgi:hypothetical protein
MNHNAAKKVTRRYRTPDVESLISRIRAGDDAQSIIHGYNLSYGKLVELACRIMCFGLIEQGMADIKLSSPDEDIQGGWDVMINGIKIDFTTDNRKKGWTRNKKGAVIVFIPRAKVGRWAVLMGAGSPAEALGDFLNHVGMETEGAR